MEILNSDWFINMLKQAGRTPTARLLALFDVLDNWCEAPGIREQLALSPPQYQPCPLQAYLCLEAANARAVQPEMLASQLYYIAQFALIEKLNGLNPASVQHAKSAAKALLEAQTSKEYHISQNTVYAMAASFVGVAVVAASLLFLHHQPAAPQHQATSAQLSKPFITAAKFDTTNADHTADLFAQIEEMRGGDCQLIEALQLPDSYKKIYFENIVLGQISTVPEEQKIVRELLQKIRCNYTPKLMANSK